MRKLNAAQSKTQFIRFRLTPNAAQVAQVEADSLGMSVDELARLRLLAGLLEKQPAPAGDVAA